MKHYEKIISLFQELKKEHPSFSIARHIATAIADYGDIWGMTDKEFLFALTKYQAELNMDTDRIADDQYVSDIIKDAENLSIIENYEDGD